MLPAIGGFPVSDRPLFLAGYSELCKEDLTGRQALEICAGAGKLAVGLARVFPGAKITSLDFYVPPEEEIGPAMAELPGLSFVAGDAFDLSGFADESLDLVWGQAALHHLSHDLTGVSRQVLRVLKPGGRMVFIFEPLGHNLFVAAIRAVRMARHELGDESNLYFSQFEKMLGCGFRRCEVQSFNLLGYLAKALSDRFRPVAGWVHRMDRFLFNTFPGSRRYGANGNLIFTK